MASEFTFVIDTDTYAGNFERPLTAFITGVIGECGVGEEEAEMFKLAHPTRIAEFEDLIAQRSDDHGCHRPTAIHPTPGYFNDGLGTEYPESASGSKALTEQYREKLRREQAKGSLQHRNPDTDLPGQYPAYLSVGIYLHHEPSQQVVEFMKARAREFVALLENKPDFADPPVRYVGPFKITGFRLVATEVVHRTVQTWPA